MVKTFKYLLCAAAMLTASTSASADTGQGNGNKGPRLWGCLYNSNTWNEDGSDAGLYRINLQPSISSEKIFTNDECYANGGARIHDGRYGVFSCDYSGAGYGVVYTDYLEFNYTSGNRVYSRRQLSTSLASIETAQYVETGDVYGVYYNSDMSALEFGKMNFDEFTRSTIGEATHFYLALGISSEKDLYGVATDGNLYKIDIYDGTETLVGNTGVTGLTNDSGQYYPQSGEIDQSTDTFYWNAVTTSGGSALYTIDLKTGKATKIGDMPNGESYVGLCIPPLEDQGDGPARIGDLDAVFPNGGAEGTVTFTAPTLTMNGDEIGEQMTYTVTMNNSIDKKITGTVMPGEKVSVNVTGFDGGTNVIAAKVESSKGACPEEKLLKYVGFDTPLPVGNVSFTYSNATGKATVTWDAPTGGVKGGFLGELVYNVTRYPGAVKVATGISELTVSEALPATDNTAYYYGIVAVNGFRESDMAQSRTQTIGPGYDTPYNADLSDEQVFNTFTVIDANKDGKTWSYGKVDNFGTSDKNTAVSMYSIDNDADDWIITPPVKLQKGKTYDVKFTAQSAYSKFDQKMEVKYGNDALIEAMTATLLEPTILPGTPTEYTMQIIPTADGKYYIGFHDISQVNMFRTALHSVSVTEVTPTGISAIDAAPADSRIYTIDGRLANKNASLLQKGVYIMNGKKIVK